MGIINYHTKCVANKQNRLPPLLTSRGLCDRHLQFSVLLPLPNLLQLLLDETRRMPYSLRSAQRLERFVEGPAHCLLHRLVEHKGQERNGGKTELSQQVSWFSGEYTRIQGLTPMGPYVLNLTFLTSFIARPEYRTILCIVKAGSPILATL